MAAETWYAVPSARNSIASPTPPGLRSTDSQRPTTLGGCPGAASAAPAIAAASSNRFPIFVFKPRNRNPDWIGRTDDEDPRPDPPDSRRRRAPLLLGRRHAARLDVHPDPRR